MTKTSKFGLLIFLNFHLVTSTYSASLPSLLNSNITHCMECISNITFPIIQNLPSAKCTDGPPKRCGMYQISLEDNLNTLFPGKLSWKPCAKDRECSRKLIEHKSSPCSLDSCLGHARDIFLGKNSHNCGNSGGSPLFDQFWNCYNPELTSVTQTETSNTERMPSLPTTQKPFEPSTLPDMGVVQYMNQKDKVMFIGLIGSFVALVVVSILVYVFRNKMCNRIGSTAPSKSNGMAVNKEYFERRNKARDDDDVSSGFEDGAESPITEFTENILMEPVTPRTPPPHVFFQHHLSNIEPLTVGSGMGHFGSVSKAIYTNEFGEVQRVAIKSLIRYNFNKVMEEAQIACLMDHPNVLKLLGIFIENETLKLVFPFMERADLGDYLRKEKGRVTPTLLRSFCIEVASGMEYLASKKVVHRDLAARNCMLDAELRVKVADFGLSRKLSGSDSHHRMVATSVIPQSSAPECFLVGGKINEKTDVWAFGVTCWEIFNEAAVPPIMVQNDGTLIGVAPAKKCPTKIYELMLRCWSYDQDQRPFFSDIYRQLMSLEYMDFVPNAPAQIASQNIPRNNYSVEPSGERFEKFCNRTPDLRGYLPKPDE